MGGPTIFTALFVRLGLVVRLLMLMLMLRKLLLLMLLLSWLLLLRLRMYQPTECANGPQFAQNRALPLTLAFEGRCR